MKGMESGVDKLVENGGSPEYVAKVVLDAIMGKKPKTRYLAGKGCRANTGYQKQNVR